MDRDKKKAFDTKTAEVVVGNYNQSDIREAVFKGIERAIFVSVHQRPMEKAKLHRNAFRAAAQAGVSGVIYITLQIESYAQRLAGRRAYGLRDWDLEAWISSGMAKGKKETSTVGDTPERLLGRKACSLR